MKKKAPEGFSIKFLKSEEGVALYEKLDTAFLYYKIRPNEPVSKQPSPSIRKTLLSFRDFLHLLKE